MQVIQFRFMTLLAVIFRVGDNPSVITVKGFEASSLLLAEAESPGQVYEPVNLAQRGEAMRLDGLSERGSKGVTVRVDLVL